MKNINNIKNQENNMNYFKEYSILIKSGIVDFDTLELNTIHEIYNLCNNQNNEMFKSIAVHRLISEKINFYIQENKLDLIYTNLIERKDFLIRRINRPDMINKLEYKTRYIFKIIELKDFLNCENYTDKNEKSKLKYKFVDNKIIVFNDFVKEEFELLFGENSINTITRYFEKINNQMLIKTDNYFKIF